MYENRNWIYKNICIEDSHDMKFDYFSGNHCFIIGHHIKTKTTIEEAANKLIRGGFNYFNIFGQEANAWAEAIVRHASPKRQIKLEKSSVDSMKMSYDLAMLAKLKEKSINFVISDDEYFTEYLIEDLQEIFSGKSLFTPLDWKKFRDGYEFNYSGKDAIISISKDIVIGFLGEEKIFENTDKSFRYKIFDGSSFNEIWDEISSN